MARSSVLEMSREVLRLLDEPQMLFEIFWWSLMHYSVQCIQGYIVFSKGGNTTFFYVLIMTG